MQGTQIDVAHQELHVLRHNVVGATTERQLAQAQASVQTFQAEQDLLMRHTLLSLNQQLAAANARDAQREMEEAVRGAEADGRWRAWERAVVADYGENVAAQNRAAGEIRGAPGVRGASPSRAQVSDPRDMRQVLSDQGRA